MWSKRIDGLGDRPADGKPGKGPLMRSRVMEEGSLVTSRLLDIAIRALDYAPVVDLRFGDFLSAALTADSELVTDYTMYYFRDGLRASFAAFGLPPSNTGAARDGEPGLWDPPEYAASLDYSNTHFESMRQDPDEVFRFIWENRRALKLCYLSRPTPKCSRFAHAAAWGPMASSCMKLSPSTGRSSRSRPMNSTSWASPCQKR